VEEALHNLSKYSPHLTSPKGEEQRVFKDLFLEIEPSPRIN